MSLMDFLFLKCSTKKSENNRGELVVNKMLNTN